MQYHIVTLQQLGHAVRASRRGHRLSQAEVAGRIGMLPKTVSRLERDPGSAMVDSLFDLLSALDLEIVLQPKGRDESAEALPW
ncbi:MAG: helix-turn-helix domain-containing protein [Bacteroidetes bacterium]|nr:helix-turn-helix domain-containing protein [Bacteroidota bacterium]